MSDDTLIVQFSGENAKNGKYNPIKTKNLQPA